MNAKTLFVSVAKKSVATRKRQVLLVVSTVVCLWLARKTEPVFNDANYVALRDDLDRTIALPQGSPEQTVAYMCLGKHIKTPVYGKVTGLDVVHWVRDPENPLRPLLRKHPQLTKDWDTKDADGLSNADHYQGFVAGPVSGARILFMESAVHNLDRMNALLVQHAGTDPETLDLKAQEALLYQVFVEDAEGRSLVLDLTSRRLIGAQAEGYRTLVKVVAAPGLALRWTQHQIFWIMACYFALVSFVRVVRQLRRVRREMAKVRRANRPDRFEVGPVSPTFAAGNLEMFGERQTIRCYPTSPASRQGHDRSAAREPHQSLCEGRHTLQSPGQDGSELAQLEGRRGRKSQWPSAHATSRRRLIRHRHSGTPSPGNNGVRHRSGHRLTWLRAGPFAGFERTWTVSSD